MDFLKNFANLIKVKTIVTLIVIIVFAVLSHLDSSSRQWKTNRT